MATRITGVGITQHDGVNTTTAAIEIPPTPSIEAHPPEWLRLPKQGQLCPWTNLSRGFLNSLILPQPVNNFCPPVKSYAIRQPGSRFGVRLISYAALKLFIESREDKFDDSKTKGPGDAE
jgi:hypothetical protein